MTEDFNPVFADDGQIRELVSLTDYNITTLTAEREVQSATSRIAKTVTANRRMEVTQGD